MTNDHRKQVASSFWWTLTNTIEHRRHWHQRHQRHYCFVLSFLNVWTTVRHSAVNCVQLEHSSSFSISIRKKERKDKYFASHWNIWFVFIDHCNWDCFEKFSTMAHRLNQLRTSTLIGSMFSRQLWCSIDIQTFQSVLFLGDPLATSSITMASSPRTPGKKMTKGDPIVTGIRLRPFLERFLIQWKQNQMKFYSTWFGLFLLCFE